MTGRGPTSHDVARAAGVSQSAVSRAFTPGASVSPEMRARIEKVAAMLGYRPSRLPGIMRRGKSGIVAVLRTGCQRARRAAFRNRPARASARHARF